MRQLDYSDNPERMFETEPAAPVSSASGSASATYDERLNRILETATQVIADVGYERASMRAVSRAAKVSLAGLYYYFPNKERMLFLIQYRTFNALLNKLREKLHGIDDPQHQLRIMVRTHLGYFAANMAALKVCSHELDSLSGPSFEETLRIRREYYQVVRAIVDRLLAGNGQSSTLDGHVATMALFGMLNWLYRWYDPKHGRAPAAVANQFAAQFLSGLQGAPADNGAADAPASGADA
ncbi:MAG: TetR/AcrR family transcriptional regulator [Planctomycetota bacterium]